MNKKENIQVAVIGLGYVGLPLAVEFGKKFPTVGFDINDKRVQELNRGHDHTFEVNNEDLKPVIASSLDSIRSNKKGCTYNVS